MRHDILKKSAGTPNTKKVKNEAGTATSRFVGCGVRQRSKMRRSTPRAVVRFPVVKASSPRRTSRLLLALRERRIFFLHFSLRAPCFHPYNAHTRTHVRTDHPTTLLPTSRLVTPSHSASSPCSQSYTVRGYKLTMFCSSWLGAGSNHAKGWCVSLPSSILQFLVFTWYTAAIIVLVFI